MNKKVLVIDNYDSFTYNLVHLIESLSSSTLGYEVLVRRNDKISVAEVAAFDRLVLSPGPGIPNEAGMMPEIVRSCAGKISMLGVCLGHQCIAEQFGGTLVNLPQVVHGKKTATDILDEQDPLFAGVPRRFDAGRYHSWAVMDENFPADLTVTARSIDGVIMALRHKEWPVWGVQFHPESVLTEVGRQLLANWLQFEPNPAEMRSDS